MFNLIFDDNETIVSVRDFKGQELSFDPETQTFDEGDPLVIELRKWEATRNIDLIAWANRPPENNDANFDEVSYTYTQRISGLFSEILPQDRSKFKVNPGSGVLVDNKTNPEKPVIHKIEFKESQIFDFPELLKGEQTSVYAYLYWDKEAIALGYQKPAPISDDLIDKLFVCAVLAQGDDEIDSLSEISLADEPETKQLLDLGAINLEGASFTPIPDTMSLSFSGGRFKFAGRNAYTNPKLPHTLTYEAKNPASIFFCDAYGRVISSGTEFNFNQLFDLDTAEVRPLLDPNYASTQFLYLFPSGAIASVLGVNEYTSLDLAADRWSTWETLRRPNNFRNNSYFLGAIAGVGSATDIGNTKQVLIARN